MITEHEARAILHVSPSASARELRRAFRRRVLETHPDRHPDDSHATRRLMRVVAAYELLRLGPGAGRAPGNAPANAEPARAVTPKSRFHCPRCEDSFEISGSCTRCDLPLWDSLGDGARPRVGPDAAVERLIEQLESPHRRREPRIESAQLPYYVSAGLFSAGLFIALLGPVSPGLAIASYGMALGAFALFSDVRLRQLAQRFE